MSELDDDSPALKAEPTARRPRVVDSEDESAPPPKRRAPNVDSDSDSDSEHESDHVSDSQEDPDEHELKPEPQPEPEPEPDELLHPGPARQRDGETQYGTGSIVRITLRNFLTFDKTSFAPGPHLNLVIGPNGVGKSSISAAIAIGLGFAPKVIGAHPHLTRFVKNGCEEAEVEIELKGRPGRKNYKIKRVINNKDESSVFFVDGEKSQAQVVKKIVESLDIRLGNLCTFLPQNRVASFSALNPFELLKETEACAGHPRLSEWHEMLIEAFKRQCAHEITLNRTKEHLQREMDKQRSAEHEVAQLRARQGFVHDLAVLELLLIVLEHAKSVEELGHVKGDWNAMKADLDELEAENQPFQESHQTLKDQVQYFAGTTEAIGSYSKKATNKIKDISKGLNKLKKESKAKDEALANLKRDEQNRLKQIKKSLELIKTLTVLTADRPLPVTAHVAAINADTRLLLPLIAAKRVKVAELRGEATDLNHKRQSLDKDGKRLEVHSVTTFIILPTRERNVRSENYRREQYLRQHELSTHVGLHYLRGHKACFKGKVHEPVLLVISPKDLVQTSLLEAVIPKALMRSFVFEKREDYDLMMRDLNDKGRSVHGKLVQITGGHLKAGASRTDYPRGFTNAQLEAWGFDCLAIDLVKGPAHVLAYLCDKAGLHMIPISFGNRPVNAAAVEASRLVKKYVTPAGTHTLRFSQYSPNAVPTVEQRALPESSVFKLRVDQDRLDEIIADREKLVEQIAKLLSEQNELKLRDAEAKRELKEDEDARDALVERRKKLQKPLTDYNMNKTKLRTEKALLAERKAAGSQEAKRAALEHIVGDSISKRLALVVDHRTATFKLVGSHLDAVEAHLRHLQADTDLRSMASAADEKDAEVAAVAERFDELEEQLRKRRDVEKKLKTEASRALAEADEDVRKDMVARKDAEPQPTFQQVELARDDAQARLDGMSDVPGRVLAEYEGRAAKIEKLRQDKRTAQESLDAVLHGIEVVKAKWLPRLEHLVSKIDVKFTAGMRKLGLMGEVRISKDPSFEKWGIEILVSFREGEKLNALTNHRQSGGERAVSTVTFLLALTDVANSPFGLVDEINQGMDRKFERAIHNQLVRTTCRDSAGQWFLLTPKLLPSLETHEKMKILIINNGLELPPKLSLRGIVDRRMKRNLQLPHIAGFDL